MIRCLVTAACMHRDLWMATRRVASGEGCTFHPRPTRLICGQQFAAACHFCVLFSPLHAHAPYRTLLVRCLVSHLRHCTALYNSVFSLPQRDSRLYRTLFLLVHPNCCPLYYGPVKRFPIRTPTNSRSSLLFAHFRFSLDVARPTKFKRPPAFQGRHDKTRLVGILAIWLSYHTQWRAREILPLRRMPLD